MLKKTIISCAMIGVVALAVASSGGGDKKKAGSLRNDFTPIRTTNGFTLKAGATYTGSHIFSSVRNNNMLTLNSVVTYQRGNNVFILPHRSRVNISTSNNSRNAAVDFKIRLHK